VPGKPPTEGVVESVQAVATAGSYNVTVRVNHDYGSFSVPVCEAKRGDEWDLLEGALE
jgi:hypothetical protein